jgi:uncharacterized membrane protein
MKDIIVKIITSMAPYKSRVIGVVVAFIIAILFLTIGFFKTLLILICISIGYIIGYFLDDKEDFSNVVDKVLSRVKGDK